MVVRDRLKSAETEDQEEVKEELKKAEAALALHDRIQHLQRVGMLKLVDDLKEDESAAVFHFDAKSKYFLPFFHQEIRCSVTARHPVQAYGNESHPFQFWVQASPGLSSVVVVGCAAFHDMVHQTSETLLLEESAGNQDSDLIGSLVYLFVTERLPKAKRSLTLIVDNCRSASSFLLLLSSAISCLFLCCPNSSNKSYKLLCFMQLLVDAGTLDEIALYYL